MGKGDQKTRRGKLFAGSYGVRRPRKKQTNVFIPPKPVIKTETTVGTETKPKTRPATAKTKAKAKPAAKAKTTVKKAATKKDKE
jgi:30S ribosomal protein S31